MAHVGTLLWWGLESWSCSVGSVGDPGEGVVGQPAARRALPETRQIRRGRIENPVLHWM